MTGKSVGGVEREGGWLGSQQTSDSAVRGAMPEREGVGVGKGDR